VIGAISMINRSEVCAVLVTYFPGSGCTENLAAVASQVGATVIVDNGTTEQVFSPVGEAARRLGATVIRMGDNAGIAAALNVGAQFATQRGYRWLATFDQDSRAPPEMIEDMARALAIYPDAERVAIVSPCHVDRVIGFALKERGAEAQGPGWRVVPSIMTSGNLVRLDALHAVGGFDQSLFIDCVDHDFCMRLRGRGYRILEATHARLLHSLGSMERRLFIFKRVTVTNHPPVRRYYISRNRIILWRRYWKQEPLWVLRDMRRLLFESVYVVLYERQVREKLGMIIRGVGDAIRNRRGPFQARG
jgi:rhamnosyltransferase